MEQNDNPDESGNSGNSQEFDTISRMAAEIDGQAREALHGPAPEPTEAQLTAADPVLQWMFVPVLLKNLLLPMLPEVAPAFSDDNCRNVAVNLANCDAEYGWGGARMPAWLGLGIAAMPMAAATVMAVKLRRDDARMRAAREEAALRETPQFPGEGNGEQTAS